MLVLNSCASLQKNKPAEQTPLVVYRVPYVYFPKVPYPGNNVVTPLDADLHAVTDTETEIVFLLIPYWYAEQWLKYAEGTKAAVDTLYSKNNTTDTINNR